MAGLRPNTSISSFSVGAVSLKKRERACQVMPSRCIVFSPSPRSQSEWAVAFHRYIWCQQSTLGANFVELRKAQVRRISIPRTPVNKGEVGDSGPLSPAPTYTLPQQERHQEGNDDDRNPDCTPPRPRARRHSLTL